MPDRWHQLKQAVETRSDLTPADRQVYLDLLHNGHAYKTARAQAEHAPSLGAISRRTGLSRRQVAYSIRHLERHGWIEVIRGGGRGHRSVYAVTCGELCECIGRRHVAVQQRVQPKGATSQVRGGSDYEGSRAVKVTVVAAPSGRSESVQPNSATPQVRQPKRTESTVAARAKEQNPSLRTPGASAGSGVLKAEIDNTALTVTRAGESLDFPDKSFNDERNRQMDELERRFPEITRSSAAPAEADKRSDEGEAGDVAPDWF